MAAVYPAWDDFFAWLEQEYVSTTARRRFNDALAFCKSPRVYETAPSRDRQRQYNLAMRDLHVWLAIEEKRTGEAPVMMPGPVPEPPPPPRRLDRREIRQRKKTRTAKLPMDAGDLRAIHGHARQRAPHDPAYAVILTMCETAFRVGDVLRIPRADLEVGFQREDGVFPVVVKGGKQALASTRGSKCWTILREHMRAPVRVNVAEAVTPSNPDPTAGAAAYKAVYRSLHETCVAVRVEPVSPHKLRHAVATWLRRHTGAGREEIRDLLVHETIEQGATYLDGAGGNPTRIADLLAGFNDSFYLDGGE